MSRDLDRVEDGGGGHWARALEAWRVRREAVAAGGRLAGDRGRALFLARALRGLGVGAHRDALDLRQILAEPGVALGERLGMGINTLYRSQFIFFGQKILLDPQLDLGADAQRRDEQQ